MKKAEQRKHVPPQQPPPSAPASQTGESFKHVANKPDLLAGLTASPTKLSPVTNATPSPGSESPLTPVPASPLEPTASLAPASPDFKATISDAPTPQPSTSHDIPADQSRAFVPQGPSHTSTTQVAAIPASGCTTVDYVYDDNEYFNQSEDSTSAIDPDSTYGTTVVGPPLALSHSVPPTAIPTQAQDVYAQQSPLCQPQQPARGGWRVAMRPKSP